MNKLEEIKKAPGHDTARATITINSLAYLDKKSSIVSIIPDCIYHFKRKPGSATRFVLVSFDGEPIQDFPSTYNRGVDAGLKYVVFRKMEAYHLKKWSYCLELSKHKMFTGLNLITGRDGIARGYGDNISIGRRDCVLVQYSSDGQYLDVALVFDNASKAEEVYQAWIEDI